MMLIGSTAMDRENQPGSLQSPWSPCPTQIRHYLRRGRAIVGGSNYLRHEHMRVSGCGASVDALYESRAAAAPLPQGMTNATSPAAVRATAAPQNFSPPMSGLGLVSRASPVQTAMRNCTR